MINEFYEVSAFVDGDEPRGLIGYYTDREVAWKVKDALWAAYPDDAWRFTMIRHKIASTVTDEELQEIIEEWES